MKCSLKQHKEKNTNKRRIKSTCTLIPMQGETNQQKFMSISTHSNLQKPSTPKLELSEVKKRGCENALLLCAMKG